MQLSSVALVDHLCATLYLSLSHNLTAAAATKMYNGAPVVMQEDTVP